MEDLILGEITERGITRLCHFTKSKNLGHILDDFEGILATSEIPNGYKDVNDFERYDGKPDYVCCSIQYPNFFYFNRIKNNDILFKEWIILSIKPEIMIKKDTLFSKTNAATERGKYLNPGVDGLRAIFDPSIETRKRTITRKFTMPNNCPTDLQAEVLILKEIHKDFIQGIIVSSERQAREEEIRMEICNIKDEIPIIVAPDLFSKDTYRNIEFGILPEEIVWK